MSNGNDDNDSSIVFFFVLSGLFFSKKKEKKYILELENFMLFIVVWSIRIGFYDD